MCDALSSHIAQFLDEARLGREDKSRANYSLSLLCFHAAHSGEYAFYQLSCANYR